MVLVPGGVDPPPFAPTASAEVYVPDPTAVDDSATLDEDDPATPIDVIANDTNPGAKAVIQSKTHGSHGTVAITNSGVVLTYTRNANYCNTDYADSDDTFSYTLNGGSSATVAVEVNCVDEAVTPAPAEPTPVGNSGGSDGGDGGAGGIQEQQQVGTNSGDILTGSDFDDVINGLAGDDLITGGLGDDVLVGGDGDDEVSGGDGDDLVRGGMGSDKLDGGRGKDTVLGGRGNDKVTADDGNADRVSCGKGKDTVVADDADTIGKNCEKVR